MIPFIFEPGEAMIFATVEKDRRRLINFYKSAPRHCALTIELRAVKYFDSAGLALLIEAKRMAKQFNSSCKIKGIPEQLKALARFCGVEEILGTDEKIENDALVG